MTSPTAVFALDLSEETDSAGCRADGSLAWLQDGTRFRLPSNFAAAFGPRRPSGAYPLLPKPETLEILQVHSGPFPLLCAPGGHGDDRVPPAGAHSGPCVCACLAHVSGPADPHVHLPSSWHHLDFSREPTAGMHKPECARLPVFVPPVFLISRNITIYPPAEGGNLGCVLIPLSLT